jgi:hypothetical protein
MKDQYKCFLIYWLPVVLYCTVIFIQSAYPSMIQIRNVPFGDKYLHFIGYAILGMLFFQGFQIIAYWKTIICGVSVEHFSLNCLWNQR